MIINYKILVFKSFLLDTVTFSKQTDAKASYRQEKASGGA